MVDVRFESIQHQFLNTLHISHCLRVGLVPPSNYEVLTGALLSLVFTIYRASFFPTVDVMVVRECFPISAYNHHLDDLYIVGPLFLNHNKLAC